MFKTLCGLTANAFWRVQHQITPHQLDVSSHSIRAGHGGNSLFGAGRFLRVSASFPHQAGVVAPNFIHIIPNFAYFFNENQKISQCWMVT